MAARRTSAPPRLAALALALLCCASLVAAQKSAGRPQKPIRGLADLVCDGQLRSIEMAQAPFPTGPPWTPLNPATDFTCTRTLPGTSFTCGSQASDKCDTITFAPVLQSSGNTPGIIPPNNPLRFTIKDTSTAYLTFVQFRGGDIGTGGARLRALYGAGSTLQPETFDHQWTVNGPQNIPGNPQPVYGPCTDCRNDFGIKVMSLTALPGAGFRSIELSQLYGDTRCGGSGVNNDTMLWTGMNYKCVVPTCGDTDLNTEGEQPFAGCTGDDQSYNAANAGTSPPSVPNCCLAGSNATCKSLAPPDGPPFTCPDGYQYNPAGDGNFPKAANCCLQKSCGDVEPATKPGTKFDCGKGLVYNPANAAESPPTAANCCRTSPEPTCGDTIPGVVPPVPFNCTAVSPDLIFEQDNADESPPSVILCCRTRIDDPPDVFVIRRVTPAIDANDKVSKQLPVGSRFTFTFKVGVNANPGVSATDVVLTSVLPRGLTLVNLVEGTRRQTTLKACSFTPRQFTCTWPRLGWNEQRLVIIKARADTAGNHSSCATVTTTSADTNPANNRDCATARVSGACCTVNKDRCANLLPEQCTSGNIVDPDNSCETSTKCKQTPSDKGACCNLRTGECIDNVLATQCSGSQFTNFRPNGTCGKDYFCTGSCCLSTSTGECKDNVPKKECVAPGTWVLFGQCDIDCPKKCVPPWNSCNPSVDDPCCNGYSCQPTYKRCVVGSYACKPKHKPCYSRGLCGGHFGACCEGYTCSWFHFKGIGKCVASNSGCQWGGGYCHKDWDCCPGAMCNKGLCRELSYNSCKKKCFSYQCYAQRKKECDAFFAAAASM